MKKKGKWIKYEERRKEKDSGLKVVLSGRFLESEAMWIYGEATNQDISVSEFIRRAALKSFPGDGGKFIE